MRYGSVCSGIEAATAAWHPLGWEPVFFSEIDPFPRAVLAHHYPDVPLHGDFTTIQRGDYADIDVLVGGTPCQSFSVAGLRKGLSDPRGNLMLGFGALAQRLRPEWLVWENVPGVLSSNGGRDFGSFLGMLAELGYGFAYRVLDAQYFGVAQRRRRVFVVGHAGDWRRAAAVLFERHGLSGNPAPSRKAGKAAPTIPSRSTAGGGLGTDFDCDGGLIPQTVGALTDGAHMGGGTTDRTPTPAGYLPSLSLCLNAGAMGRQDAETETLIATNGGVFDASEDGPMAFDAFNQVETGAVSKTLLSRNDQYTGSVVFDTTQITSPANYSNPQPGDACHPLAAGAHAPAVAASMQVRRLTPRECERLQGFPDDFTAIPYRGKPADQCPDGPRYKSLGNSMAVPVMAWIGRRIAAVDAIGAMETHQATVGF